MITDLSTSSSANQRRTSGTVQHGLGFNWVSPSYQLVAPFVQVNLQWRRHRVITALVRRACPYPGSSRRQKSGQLGQRLQILVKARADLLCDAILTLVVLPQSNLQVQKPVTSLQETKLERKT